jgi:cytochrome c
MNILTLLGTTPVPRDLPLPLPLPEGLLKALLVIFFLIHILFVNLTVGGSLLVTILEWIGFRHKRYDHLALELAKTVTVNKSLAVVMGIGPLLCINLVYTLEWYGANALTGHAWLLIIPLITLAFLLAYLHKYTWHRWETGNWKRLHWSISILSTLLFLCIPFVFLANVNLMLFPSEWEKVKGFFSALKIGNVFPRYLHFMLASIALTGLAGAGWFWRQSVLEHLPEFTREELRRTFYRIALWATGCQFLAGPLLLFTLPGVGVTATLYKIILPSAALGISLWVLLLKKVRSADTGLAQGYAAIVALFSVVVLGMGSGRHAYREAAVASHKAAVKERSETYEKALADWNAANPPQPEEAAQSPEQLFATCAACHAVDHRLVGPPLTEIAQIYKGNPAGIVKWAMGPGKKRPDYPQMPSFSHLGEENLTKIAEYMLATGGK